MSDLPTRLSESDQEIVFLPRRDDALSEFKAAIDREYVHLKFTETRGGTELGFPLDAERSDLSGADWESGEGSIHLEGDLELDGVAVRCIADLELGAMKGTGRLEIR